MRKLLLSFYFACCILHFTFFTPKESFGQAPLVKQWDYRFGGTSSEFLFSFKQTIDGGFILSGWSISDSSCNKTSNDWGSADYWIVETDSLGNKQWDKDFGGSGGDKLYSSQQTADRGYILGGNSSSGISGDKTQPLWDTCFSCTRSDYWIVKTDSLGNKQWDKDFGGTNEDYLYSLQQTTDGGYIFGGYSSSGIGGDKTDSLRGGTGDADYWIIKTDSLGNKQWDKDFGGTNEDYLFSLQQTTDGGYVLGGYSSSGVGGDKTQPNWDTILNTVDYWIVKIDSIGNKQWDKDLGGVYDDFLYSLQQTADGGYILGGISTSDSSGDKTQPLWNYSADYWIIKIDSLGNKQWDKDFGGNLSEDEFGNVYQTADGGYLIAGSSYSPLSGNKTENNLGVEQTWIVKTDSLGNMQWDKTIFTPGHDEYGFAIQTEDGCYAFATSSNGGIGGYKTHPNCDTICNPICPWDHWIVKFCDTTSTTSITQLPDYPNTFSIYPNPANEYVTINYHFKAGDEIRLTDVLGKLLFTTKITVPTLNFKLQTLNLSTGIYFLKAGNEVRKFVKE